MTLEGWKDKALFTPGPLTTSRTVKEAMLRDYGSRDDAFVRIVREIRSGLLSIAGACVHDYAAIPMQGSGTFGLEAVLASTVPPDGAVLICINGAYGRRLANIASTLGIETVSLEFAENEPLEPGRVAEMLAQNPSITHVCACHCETTSGILNPVEELGAAVAEAGRVFFVDAMSSFGAIDIDVHRSSIGYLVSSANKCIEGVPGFSFVIARLDHLKATRGWARSVSLDLLAQWEGLEKNGQFRFTPPTHALLAFRQALRELEEEGGVSGRGARYSDNQRTLIAGARRLGLREYLPEERQSCIITSFLYPEHPAFDFNDFYKRLSSQNYLIYPGKVGDADCFRIGTIGRIFPQDVRDLIGAMEETLREMGVAS
jgi:2-aminoethylphosphonate-pyruvate transaminase